MRGCSVPKPGGLAEDEELESFARAWARGRCFQTVLQMHAWMDV